VQQIRQHFLYILTHQALSYFCLRAETVFQILSVCVCVYVLTYERIVLMLQGSTIRKRQMYKEFLKKVSIFKGRTGLLHNFVF